MSVAFRVNRSVGIVVVYRPLQDQNGLFSEVLTDARQMVGSFDPKFDKSTTVTYA